jgi:hypothetical protein
MMLDKLLIFGAAPSGCENQFFGLVPWYHYLPATDFGGKGTLGACDINGNFSLLPTSGGGDLPLVLLAVVDDLLRIAGMIAVGFVIYGAIQYIASQGSPDATAKAQSTIINALIGLAIAIVAITFVSFLGRSLGGA